MRYCILFFTLLFATDVACASDSLQIGFNKRMFVKGDTLEFTCTIPDYAALKLNAATLNVWIDDLEGHKRWKFRYPVIGGEVTASLAVTDKIADGRYAVNFIVQPGYFRVSGEINKYDKRDSVINYIMMATNKKSTYFDDTHVADDGSFRLKSTLFADSAFFIFSPVKKIKKNNYLSIKIKTPLDSTFTPAFVETHFVTIGDPKMVSKKRTDTASYHFTMEEPVDADMLPGITVRGKYKKRVEQYNAEYSRGLFDKPDAIIFDGLDNDEISRSADVLSFLQGRVPGLTVDRNETGEQIVKWRNSRVEIYVDEFLLDTTQHLFISPWEVAMIKVYQPPAELSGHLSNLGNTSPGGGASPQLETFSSAGASGGSESGAVAIYTKKGNYLDVTGVRHNFIIRGYTNFESSWY